MRTLFIVCQHGDEKTPLEVIKEDFQRVPFLLANPKALEKNVRFIEKDMNRSFPGNSYGSKEEGIAMQILKDLKSTYKDFESIIDLHTASCSTPAFVILTKISKKHMELIGQTGIDKVVVMSPTLASGKALVDHVPCGISIEFGLEGTAMTRKRIKDFFNYFLSLKQKDKKIDYFRVFDVLKKENESEKLVREIRAFKLVKRGSRLTNYTGKIKSAHKDFYPILPRSRNYKDLLCLMAEKIHEKDDMLLQATTT